MIEFKEISGLTLDELFKELGMADFTYIETSSFLEKLENYRQAIHLKIKERQSGPSKYNVEYAPDYVPEFDQNLKKEK